jgi:hypothetical protein
MPEWAAASRRGNGRASSANGSDPYGDGWGASASVQVLDRDDGPVVYVDEDVHIVVHRSDELYVQDLRTALAR